ncbi:hypothetical protein HHK36_031959 [Tetracentron sinense]|uniref:Uncharacterized protein n=1 Tax=Tetracentron sinense TaxID=13715 RepID=A0A835D0V8_TETSI|nr:hypothetical protein HHK36_031959 [Tetracentron sinense]
MGTSSWFMSTKHCICFAIGFFLFSSNGYALKAPFRPQDLLPFLPREISWPLLKYLRSPVDILPTFVGSASSPNDTVEWKGACFYENKAWMEFHNKNGSEFGGGTLHLEARTN